MEMSKWGKRKLFETVHLYFVVELFKIFEDMVKLANLVSLYSLKGLYRRAQIFSETLYSLITLI